MVERRCEGAMGRRVFWLFAMLLLAIAVFLRFYKLGSKPFWIDEASDWFLINNGSILAIVTRVPGLISVSLYLLVQRIISLFDSSEAGLRLLSAFSSSVTVFIVMVIVRKVATSRASLLAGFFLTFSFIDIYYAQEGRHFAFANALAVTTTLAWLYYVENPLPKNRAFFAISALASMMTSFNSLFVVGIELLLLLAWQISGATSSSLRARLRMNIKHYRLIPVFSIVGVVLLMTIAFSVRFGEVMQLYARSIPGYRGFNLLSQVLEISRYVSGDGGSLWIILIVGCITGCFVVLPARHRKWNPAMVLPCVAAFSSMGIFLFYWVTLKIAARYFLTVLPFWTATWAIGIDYLLSLLPRQRWVGTIVAIGLVIGIAFLSVPYIKSYYSSPIKWIWSADDRAARAALCKEVARDDAAVSLDWGVFTTRYYLSKPCDSSDMMRSDGKMLRQVYLFQDPYIARQARFGNILKDDEKRSFAFADFSETGLQPEVRLTWPVKRFWMIVPAIRNAQTYDLVPWWRENPNRYLDIHKDISLPDGSFIQQRGTFVIAMVPNPSTDPYIFSPVYLKDQMARLLSSLQQ